MDRVGFHNSETEATQRLERKPTFNAPKPTEDKQEIVKTINTLASISKVTVFLFQSVLIVHSYTFDGKWYTVQVSSPATAGMHYWISSGSPYIFQVHTSGELFNAT